MKSQIVARSVNSLLDTPDVQRRYGVSRSTVERLTKQGLLTKIRIGGSVRFDPAEVEALIEAGRGLRVNDERPLTTGVADEKGQVGDVDRQPER
jgi:excisionase family DNA binding protein